VHPFAMARALDSPAMLILSMAKIVSSLAFNIEHVKDDLLDVFSSFMLFWLGGTFLRVAFLNSPHSQENVSKMASKLLIFVNLANA